MAADGSFAVSASVSNVEVLEGRLPVASAVAGSVIDRGPRITTDPAPFAFGWSAAKDRGFPDLELGLQPLNVGVPYASEDTISGITDRAIVSALLGVLTPSGAALAPDVLARMLGVSLVLSDDVFDFEKGVRGPRFSTLRIGSYGCADESIAWVGDKTITCLIDRARFEEGCPDVMDNIARALGVAVLAQQGAHTSTLTTRCALERAERIGQGLLIPERILHEEAEFRRYCTRDDDTCADDDVWNASEERVGARLPWGFKIMRHVIGRRMCRWLQRESVAFIELDAVVRGALIQANLVDDNDIVSPFMLHELADGLGIEYANAGDENAIARAVAMRLLREEEDSREIRSPSKGVTERSIGMLADVLLEYSRAA